MTDRPTAPADELGDPLVRYWDALLAGEPPDATALDPAIPATIGRFLARDDAPPPDPAFVRNLRARFAAPLGDLPADRLAVADFEPACPASVAGVAPLPAEPEPIRPWWSWLEFAAAILILVAAGGILLGRDRVAELLSDDARPGAATVTPGPEPTAAARDLPDVPMFQGNPQRTGALPGPGPADTPAVRWSVATGGAIAGAPAIADGVLYVGNADGTLYALDAQTGEERWTFAAGAGIASSPAVVDGTVYVGVGDTTADAFVLAVDATTGRERWRRAIEGPVVGAPVVGGGGLYIGTNPGVVYALDAATGEERWTFSTGGTVWAAPSYTDGTVFVGSWDSHFYAIDAATGSERWRFDPGGPIWVAAPVSDGIVFVVTPNGHQPASIRPLSLFALDAATGQALRETELPGTLNDGQPEVPPAAVDGGVVYLQRNRTLYAVDAATGALRWSGPGAPSEDVRMSALAGHVLYFSLPNGRLLAVDATNGARLWDVKISLDRLSWPVVTGGFVYVGDADGVVYALGDDQSGLASPAATPPAGA